VVNLRVQPQFENETAILLMHSALPHVSERVLRLLGQNKIMAIVFPAHTSYDKYLSNSGSRFFCSQEVETNNNGWIWRWLSQRADYQTCSCLWANRDLDKHSKFLQTSWNLSELGPRSCKIRFDEKQLRNNLGFKEPWNWNVSIADLSRRRRLDRFGVINSESLVDQITMINN
jgi:hypothetical protein